MRHDLPISGGADGILVLLPGKAGRRGGCAWTTGLAFGVPWGHLGGVSPHRPEGQGWTVGPRGGM